MERTSHERLTIKISSILVHHEQNYEGFKRKLQKPSKRGIEKGQISLPMLLLLLVFSIELAFCTAKSQIVLLDIFDIL